MRVLFVAVLVLAASLARGAGLYSQIVLPLTSERAFTHDYHKADHSLVLEIAKTSPDELKALDHYDERLIKRVLVKDLGPAGTEVKLVLRDRNVRAMVNKFTEPFRITIDLFDKDFEEEKDPLTGLPGKQPAPESPTQAGSYSLVEDVQDGHGPTEHPASAQEQPAQKSAGRRLLAPTIPLVEAPEQMTEALKALPEGVGKAWATFPPYVYRIQTAPYEEGLKRKEPDLTTALSSAEAMADFASRIYNFGHESRALLAYQQVLHRDPTVFDRDALHLWKFAETQLGQGNLTLARGYYQAIVEKHPESPIAQFAKMRILDVGAIRFLSQDRADQLPTLAAGLDQIKPRHAGEMMGLLAIRRAYWSPEAHAKESAAPHLPQIAAPVRGDLASAYPNTESSKTAFFAASLLVNDMVRPDTPWVRSSGQFAEAYFKRFSGGPTEPYRDALKDRLQAKLNKSLQAKAADGKLVEAIEDYEALPASLKSIRKTPATAWALGEAYRKLGQREKALELYQIAAKESEVGPDRFKSEFWVAVLAGEMGEELRRSNAARSQQLRTLGTNADKSSWATWQRLKADEQKTLQIAYKTPFEQAVTSKARLETPAKIVLASWTAALSTKADAASGGETNDWQRSFSPSGSAVILLTDLGKRFASLGTGFTKERRQAVSLLKQMKPAQFEDDKAAKDIWASELVKLAEDYRNANQYLEAGRLYSLVGEESENWEGRAEALYKGGLLLYRAGRRADAVAALTKASQDGNNTFYADMAKERLSQLEQ